MLKSLIHGFSWLAIDQGARMLLSVGVLSLAVQNTSTENVAIYIFIHALYSMFIVLQCLGLDTLVFSRCSRNLKLANSYLVYAIQIRFISALALLPIIYILIISKIGMNELVVTLIVASFVFEPLLVSRDVLMASGKHKIIAISSLISIILSLMVVYYFIGILGDWKPYMIGFIVFRTIYSLSLFSYVVNKNIGLMTKVFGLKNLRKLRKLFEHSFPVMLGNTIGNFTVNLPLTVLGAFISPSIVASYGAAYRIIAIVNAGPSILTNVVYQKLISMGEGGRIKHLTWFYIISIGVLCLFIFNFSNEITEFIYGADNKLDSLYLECFCLVMVFHALRTIYQKIFIVNGGARFLPFVGIMQFLGMSFCLLLVVYGFDKLTLFIPLSAELTLFISILLREKTKVYLRYVF